MLHCGRGSGTPHLVLLHEVIVEAGGGAAWGGRPRRVRGAQSDMDTWQTITHESALLPPGAPLPLPREASAS
jgi:hypothetical protein